MPVGVDIARPLPGELSSAGRIEVVPVGNRAELARFIRIPYRVHQSDPAWIPPLLMERRHALDRRRNPFFRHAKVAFWIASRHGEDVGRISAQIDTRAPPGTGWFGMLSAVDDPAIFARLLNAAETWLAQHGARRALGPFNLSINQEAGLLVDGFSTPHMMLMGHDRPWSSRHLERLGYRKAKDLLAYLVPVEGADGSRRQTSAGQSITLRPLRRANYAAEVRLIGEIFNDAWRDNWGFVPFAADEVEDMGNQMRPLVDERLAWFAEVDGNAAGFIVCLPNINEAIRDLNGALLPFGWAKLLWRLKLRGVSTARIPLLGIRQRYSRTLVGSRLAFLLIETVRRECAQLGIASVETSWILEDNLPVIRLIETFGGQRYKTYRVYERTL